jgi:uncharacterized protein
MTTQQIDSTFILTTLSKLKQRLQAEFAVCQIGLYGSFARNEQSPASDIDLINEKVMNPFVKYAMQKCSVVEPDLHLYYSEMHRKDNDLYQRLF